jgi:hypothetical protein
MDEFQVRLTFNLNVVHVRSVSDIDNQGLQSASVPHGQSRRWLRPNRVQCAFSILSSIDIA